MYFEATGKLPRAKARLISPQLPKDGKAKCLKFSFNMNGVHIGKLALLDSNRNEMWKFDGKHTGFEP